MHCLDTQHLFRYSKRLTLQYFIKIKGSISLKNRHFIVQERFNKLIHGINTIIKCDTWQPVKFQSDSRIWNEMIFYRISELMLPILIQRYDKNHFFFDTFQKWETNWKFSGCQMPHFMIVLILYTSLWNLSWIKNVYFWGIMEPLIGFTIILTISFLKRVDVWYCIGSLYHSRESVTKIWYSYLLILILMR